MIKVQTLAQTRSRRGALRTLEAVQRSRSSSVAVSCLLVTILRLETDEAVTNDQMVLLIQEKNVIPASTARRLVVIPIVSPSYFPYDVHIANLLLV